jgi:hypothetical protein
MQSQVVRLEQNYEGDRIFNRGIDKSGLNENCMV